MNIFEQATIRKLRFPSAKGELTVEQLWDLPLTSRHQFDLDTIAKQVNRELKGVAEESFVAESTSPAGERLTLMLDIVKHIIAKKKDAAAAAADAEKRREERERLLRILGDKQEDELRSLTAEQIAERIKALG